MVRIPLPWLALAAASLLCVDAALAQTPPPRPPATSKPASAPAAPPATSKAPPKKAPGRKKPKAEKPAPPILGAVVSSPSFRMLEEGKSRVFVEVNQKVLVTEQKARGRVVYKLKGAGVPVRNSLRPLLTNFFPTPVGQITLAAQDDGAALIIDLREAAEPSYRVVETPRGIAIQVDFPAVQRPPSSSE